MSPSSAFRIAISACLIITMCFGPGSNVMANGANDYDQLVVKTLRQHVETRYPDADIGIEVHPLDPRTRLRPCTDPKVSARGQQVRGRTHVELRCTTPNPWTAYLAATVTVRVPMLVLRVAVTRGHRLRAADVEEAMVDIATLRGDPLTHSDELSFMAARRNIAAGTPVTTQQLKPVPLVSRGEVVKLRAGAGSIRISTKGRAEGQGGYGDQIWVENLSSGKRVPAWISGPGQVSTTAPLPERQIRTKVTSGLAVNG